MSDEPWTVIAAAGAGAVVGFIAAVRLFRLVLEYLKNLQDKQND